MSRIHKERILDYLWSISPNRATNNQIQDATGIKSRQQVYMFTQRFLDIGWIQGQKQGGEWKFSIGESIYRPKRADARKKLSSAVCFTTVRLQNGNC